MAGYGGSDVSSKLQSVKAPVRPCVERGLLANEAEERLTDGMDATAGEFTAGDFGERIQLEKEDDVVRKVNDPKLPSASDVEKHNVMGHLPFRDWCPVCVKARGREMDHKTVAGKERNLPEYSLDYCFPGDELGY